MGFFDNNKHKALKTSPLLHRDVEDWREEDLLLFYTDQNNTDIMLH